MQYKKLKALISKIKEYGHVNKREAVFNDLRPSQKYLLMSLNPSPETDKDKGADEKHSGFEERVIALFFFGSDDKEALKKIRANYPRFKDTFFKNVYWTHYSKERRADNPDSFWANKDLKEEIRLTEPTLVITFGQLPADFLFGKGNLKSRVNKISDWNGIPVICCLHPSRNWNMRFRPKYGFDKTWNLIRSKIKLT